MPLSLEQLRALIGEQLVQTQMLTAELHASQQAADAANMARDAKQEQLRYHESVLAGLKVTLYDFFERTFIENPQAMSYAEMGAAMDAAAAATPEETPVIEPPPSAEPPPEEPPPEPPPEEAPPEEPPPEEPPPEEPPP